MSDSISSDISSGSGCSNSVIDEEFKVELERSTLRARTFFDANLTQLTTPLLPGSSLPKLRMTKQDWEFSDDTLAACRLMKLFITKHNPMLDREKFNQVVLELQVKLDTLARADMSA